MFKTTIVILAIPIVLFFIYKANYYIKEFFEYRRYKNSGVVYLFDGSYSFFRDTMALVKVVDKYPTCVAWNKM